MPLFSPLTPDISNLFNCHSFEEDLCLFPECSLDFSLFLVFCSSMLNEVSRNGFFIFTFILKPPRSGVWFLSVISENSRPYYPFILFLPHHLLFPSRNPVLSFSLPCAFISLSYLPSLCISGLPSKSLHIF